MTKRRSVTAHALLLAFLFLLFNFNAVPAKANDRAFAVVAAHLKAHYQAKQRRIPFLGLANFAMKFSHPAGVKSFKLMVFEDLHEATLQSGAELNSLLRNSLGQEWQPLARIYSRRSGEQTFVYSAAEGKNIKLLIVALQQTEATVMRVKLDTDALARFIDNPNILGISLASNQR